MSRTELDAATLAKALRRMAGDGSVEWVTGPIQASVLLDVADLMDENDKLRELVDGLTWCSEHSRCRQECPLYDVSEPDHCREVSIKRKLGIEVWE